MGHPHYLKPMGLGEILDTSVKLYRKHFRLLVAAQFPMTVYYIVVTLIETYGFGEPLTSFFRSLSPGGIVEPLLDPSLRFIPDVLFLIQLVLVKPLVLSTVIKVASDSISKTPSLKSGYTFYIQSWWKLGLTYIIPTVLLAVLVLILGTLFWVIGLFVVAFIWTRWMLTFPVAANENRFMIQSMRRSWNLVKGHTTRVFLSIIVMALIPLIIEFSPILMGTFFETSLIFLLIVFGTISEGVIVPLVDTTRVVIYFELRTRKEGYDLEQRVEKLTDSTENEPL